MWQQGIPDEQWDVALFAAGGHFLQSSHWAAFQSALGKPIFYASGDGWQCLAILEKSRTGTRLYCPYGPYAKNAEALNQALAALKQLAKAQSALFVRMEPVVPIAEEKLRAHGLKPALKDIQPRLTWVKDLTRSEDELMTEMSATNRNLHRTAINKGLTFRSTRNVGDLHVFLDMIHEVAKNTGMQPHPDSYYEKMASSLMPRAAMTMYIGEHDGMPVASALVFDSPNTRYYAHAGSRTEARKLHPGTPLVSTMIFEAKTNGQKLFDFYGIAPPDQPNHPWAGFSRFKRSFGGGYKAYLGTWEMPVSVTYHLYRGAYKAKKLLRGK
ncbi:MAG: lipid II:glycine glycyltransferase FemX [Candidatus Saccharimonadales bacterium]